jgi:hypothetical protein
VNLFHYTCRHAAQRIGVRGVLRPLTGVIWATDLFPADRDALGLTSFTLKCDRTEVCYRIIEVDRFVAFSAWWRGRLDPSHVSRLTHPPAVSRYWFVSETPARVEMVAR